MTIYLLDVNLLLALSDPLHVHHRPAHRWFSETGRRAWASCPITENGYVRVAANPRYPNRPGGPAVVMELLCQFCALPGHHFWPADISLRDVLPPDIVCGHNQVTDLYLLGLAMHHGGRMATLDQRIPASLLPQGTSGMELVPVDT